MDLETAIADVVRNLHLDYQLKPEQIAIIKAIVSKKDVFAVLPTGFGKSIVYTMIPFVMNRMEPAIRHTAIVVSPLLALIRDQTEIMRSKGINVISLSDCKVTDFPSTVSIILTTPEAVMSTKWKAVLKERVTVCLIVYDEAHCISSWGMDFRPEYRKISSLQSLFHDVPNMAMTATATQTIQEDIFTCLNFSNDCTKVVANLPDRPNVFLEVKAASENFELELDWLMQYMIEERNQKKKIILFVNSLNKCFQLYIWLTSNLMDAVYHNKERITTNRRVEMFHANTDTETKERILKDLTEEQGNIELLICTIAFGMGINIKDIDLVIYWGIPKSILHYWQEVGRCARDQRKVYAITYCYPRSLTNAEATIKTMATTKKCIRTFILKEFQLKGMSTKELDRLHTLTKCSNTCIQQCECELCHCCCHCKEQCNCPMKCDNILSNFTFPGNQ